jgi:hypothetical protein
MVIMDPTSSLGVEPVKNSQVTAADTAK